ncbi:hypothetical protein Xbed_03556 [Xenorhabdus beddingii]|uniref:Uncharacterized protein n=1 Tax=Xenorhabdus beddingii TaxID=40578 RepID=A0A1Y2SCT3_9GAMM|nr:hypothetical protein [Xenorhabdus beddingii]OTA15773.1 hypothetical protein Xbed_03556 [Xenorhabdus beddingii]
MVMQIGIDQVHEQLEMMGFEAPDFVITAAMSVVDSIDDCLDKAGYTDAVMTLIKVYSVILILSAADVRKIASEHAPSGASVSYQYFADGRKSLLKLLSALDTAGCTDNLPIDRPVGIIQFDVNRG